MFSIRSFDLKKRKKKRRNRAISRLYFSSKITEKQFLAVLWLYVLDQSLAEISREVGISVTTAHAITTKLRNFFCETGVFSARKLRTYKAEKNPSQLPDVSRDYWSYHLSRMRAKRTALPTDNDRAHQYYAESCWRYSYRNFYPYRNWDQVHQMMYRHLLEIIRSNGPVGGKTIDYAKAEIVNIRQIISMYEWLAIYKLASNPEEVQMFLRYNREYLEQIEGWYKEARTKSRKPLKD